jgi:hypothetical protein
MSLQHRLPMYGTANELTSQLIVMGALPYGDAGWAMDFRMLFLSLGAQVGLRAEWSSYSFDPAVIERQSPDGPDYVRKNCPTRPDPDDPGQVVPTGEPCNDSRNARIDMFGRDLTTGLGFVPYLELRAQLFAPLNEHVLFASLLGFEHQDRDRETFDQAYSLRHDGGWLMRWETQLFVKHRDVGAFGLFTRLVQAPRGDARHTELSYGFLALRRLGLVRRDDAIALWAMFQPGNDAYGIQQFRAPIWALLAYRVRTNF